MSIWKKWRNKILKKLGKIAVSDTCCCVENCCGRYLPGTNGGVDEWPTTLFADFTPDTCTCPATTQTFTLTWEVVGSWWKNSNVFMAGCFEVPSQLTVVCQGTASGTEFSALWTDLGVCTPEDRTVFEDACLTNPLDVSKLLTKFGLGCCGVLFGGGTITLRIYE